MNSTIHQAFLDEKYSFTVVLVLVMVVMVVVVVEMISSGCGSDGDVSGGGGSMDGGGVLLFVEAVGVALVDALVMSHRFGRCAIWN